MNCFGSSARFCALELNPAHVVCSRPSCWFLTCSWLNAAMLPGVNQVEAMTALKPAARKVCGLEKSPVAA